MRVNISRKAFIALCVASPILIALSGYSYINSQQLINSGKLVSQRNKTINLAGLVLSTILEMESHQPIAGDRIFSKDYQQTVTDSIEVKSSVTTHEIEYSIRDNGTGFNMGYAHKLFNVFQRLHKIQDYEGKGISTSLVKRIINRHGEPV